MQSVVVSLRAVRIHPFPHFHSCSLNPFFQSYATRCGGDTCQRLVVACGRRVFVVVVMDDETLSPFVFCRRFKDSRAASTSVLSLEPLVCLPHATKWHGDKKWRTKKSNVGMKRSSLTNFVNSDVASTLRDFFHVICTGFDENTLGGATKLQEETPFPEM